MKIRICIEGDPEVCPVYGAVYVDVEFPIMPRLGERVLLPDAAQDILEEKAVNFPREYNVCTLPKGVKPYVSFDDYQWVREIVYNLHYDEPIIEVILGT